MTQYPTVTLKHKFEIKGAWLTLEDADFFGVETLELAEFPRYEDETYVAGTTVFERVKELDNRAGYRHAERLLLQHEDIPVEWKQFELAFTGTLFQAPTGLCIPFLNWDDWSNHHWWKMGNGWLSANWGPKHRLVLISK